MRTPFEFFKKKKKIYNTPNKSLMNINLRSLQEFPADLSGKNKTDFFIFHHIISFFMWCWFLILGKTIIHIMLFNPYKQGYFESDQFLSMKISCNFERLPTPYILSFSKIKYIYSTNLKVYSSIFIDFLNHFK